MRIVNGNILDSEANLIVQQVNCVGAMGKGLADQIARRYPVVKETYLRFHEEWDYQYGGHALLGHVLYVQVDAHQAVANVFGQENIRSSKWDRQVYTDRHALKEGLLQVRSLAEAFDLSVAIPTHIGCGVANGNWEIIYQDIESVFEGFEKVTLYHYR